MAQQTGLTSTWQAVRQYLQLFRLSLLYQVKEFFHNSTLHGIRYIAEEHRSFGERFMWFVCTLTGLISALVIIGSLWEKFQTNPTITGLDTDFHNQVMVFPTVLLCPLQPFDREAVRTVGSALSGSRSNAAAAETYLERLTTLQYGTLHQFLVTAQNVSILGVDFKNATPRDLAFKVAAQCKDLFVYCRFKDDDLDCCDHFRPMYTELGLCHGFNMKYTLATGNRNGLAINRNLMRLMETDKKWSLTFLPTRKAHIYVHSQVESSSLDEYAQVLWDGEWSVDMLISMKQTVTTADTKQLSIGQRKCIFPDELKLEFFHEGEYTFTNCMQSCRIKSSLKLCNCIPPFYPAFAGTRYCQRMADFACLAKYRGNITDVRECGDCVLSCNNIVYEVEKLAKVDGNERGQNARKYINIEYLTWPIIRYKREVLFGWVDLLVSFGGIAGLFLGFSILSGVEIIYFFTLRAFCMVHKDRDKLEAIQIANSSKRLERFEIGLQMKNFKKCNSMTNLLKPQRSRLLLFEKTPITSISKSGPFTKNIFQAHLKPPPVHFVAPYARSTTVQRRSHSEDRPPFPYLP